MHRRLFALIALLSSFALAGALYSQRDIALVGSGWVAKRICSAVFVAGREPESVVEASLPLPVPISIPAEVDRDTRRVTAHFARFFVPSTAVYRPGLGCTLAGPGSEASPIDALPPANVAIEPTPLPPSPPRPRLEGAIASAFELADDSRAAGFGTRAVVVVHRGALAAEHYAEGFSHTTPLPGWSMTKSVTGTLVGLLADAGRIAIHEPVGLEAWSAPEDARGGITWDHLLRMSSGLAFEEDYERPEAHAIQMLFGPARGARGRYAASLALEYPIDSHWSYSSGTTNILQHALLERVFGGDLATYLRFPREALFDAVGMASAVLEPDESGVFVGSSHMLATARDWARLGLLYLNGGRVGDRAVLSPEWIEYSATPTRTNQAGTYGAHWWLNQAPASGTRRFPSLDANLLMASGFEGQFVVVVPDHDLVVVRLGLDRGERFDIEGLVAGVIEALPVSTTGG